MLNSYTKKNLQEYMDSEHGINYHKNVPLDGFVLTYGESFISFGIENVNGTFVAVLHYMYFLNSDAFYKLLSESINIWKGYEVKMIYGREHKRKSDVMKYLTTLDLVVVPTIKEKWKHEWTSTNGFKESDCLEVFSKNQNRRSKSVTA